MRVMPATRRFFRSGTQFREAFVTNPQCCPSRASIFSGQYVHNHGVDSNTEAENFDPVESWPRLLDEHGYRTGYFGKYLNQTGRSPEVPNFDRSFVGFDEDHRQHAVHSSSFIVRKAKRYLTSIEGDDSDPWAVELALRAPHVPLIYPKKYEDIDVPRWQGNPATRESDFSDKHRDLDAGQYPLSESKLLREGQLKMLAAADDALKSLYRLLRKTEEVENTLIIFMSDNGYYWGEHKLKGKVLPYMDSLRIPMLMRGPGVPDATDSRIVANIDVAPTILDATGIQADYMIDGVSLFAPHEREWLLVEGPTDAVNPRLPFWRHGYVSSSTHYFEWRDGFREYYDLRSDPWELSNLLGDRDASNDPADEEAIAAMVEAAAQCAGPPCP